MLDSTLQIQQEKKWVAMTSVIAAVVVTVFKVTVGVWTGSLGILSEAAHSGLDFFAALITFLAVRVADKPADEEHLYGHGKIENISALIETILLLFTCGWIMYEAIERLFFKSVHIEVNFWSFFVIVLSLIVDFSRSRALSRVARKYQSQALEADALHFRTDVWSSNVVLLGLVFSKFNLPQADSVAAFMVAMIVVVVSFRLGRRTVDALMDTAPEGLMKKIQTEVQKVNGVEDARNIRLRQAGSKIFVDMSLLIKRTIPFEIAHAVVHEAEKKIKEVVPFADVLIHPEPMESSDESLADKVKMIAIDAGLTPHNIQVYQLGEKFYVDLHLESTKYQNFTEAHQRATEIENIIKAKLQNVSVVKIHIDESTDKVIHSKDVSASKPELVKKIKQIALSEAKVRECSDILVMDIGGKLRVSMNCLFDSQLPFKEVHEVVTTIEDKIYLEFNNVDSVIVHAEPAETTS